MKPAASSRRQVAEMKSTRIFIVGVLSLLLAGAQSAKEKDKEALAESKKLKVLIAGKMGNDRVVKFGQFLARYFGKVDSVNLEQLTPELAARYDVVVADWERRYAHGGYQDKKPKYKLPEGFSK